MAQLLSVHAVVVLAAWFCVSMVQCQGGRRGEFFGDNLPQGNPLQFPANSADPNNPFRPFVLKKIPTLSYFGKKYDSIKVSLCFVLFCFDPNIIIKQAKEDLMTYKKAVFKHFSREKKPNFVILWNGNLSSM